MSQNDYEISYREKSHGRELNPVFVREVRQLVRNRLVVVMLNIYLLVLLVAFFYKIISTGDGWTETSGRELFTLLSTIAFGTASVCVFLYSAIRLIYDRVMQDQMFYSGLYPYQIMIGKILSGAVITALFLSVTFPFVMMAYLLRGVDLVTIFAAYLFTFLLIQQLNVVCLAFCAGIRSIVQGIGFGILLIAFLIIALIFSLFLMVSAMIAGNSFVSFLIFWVWMFFFLICLVPPTLIAFFIGVARLNPASFNSMFVIRLLVTILGVFSFLPSFLAGIGSEYFSELYIFWLFCMLAIIAIMMIVGTCERETWEARIRKKIPVEREYRLLSFLFYSGSPNAMAWGAIWLGVIFLANILVFIRFTFALDFHSTEPTAALLGITSAGVLIYNYCITAILIRNRFLSKWIPKDATWLLVIGLMIVVCGGGVFTMFLLNSANTGLDFLHFLAFVVNIPNPFGTFFMIDLNTSGESYLLLFTGVQLFFALLWGLIATVYALPWFYEAFGRFTHLDEEDLRPWEIAKMPIVITVPAEEFERERHLDHNFEPLHRGTAQPTAAINVGPILPEIIEAVEIVEELPVLGAFWNEERGEG